MTTTCDLVRVDRVAKAHYKHSTPVAHRHGQHLLTSEGTDLRFDQPAVSRTAVESTLLTVRAEGIHSLVTIGFVALMLLRRFARYSNASSI